MNPYAFAVEQAVLDVFAAASARQQRLVLDCFSRLAAHPFREPDWVDHDDASRTISVVLHDEWLISYWTDHAIRRVMIVELERVEGP
ncbi:MAG: hypothetical protein RLZZ15_2069 [Verrucomicrobiota bacterium]|jgi:hypothetical protein